MNCNVDYVKTDSGEKIKRAMTYCNFSSQELKVREYYHATVVPADLSWEHYHTGILDSNGMLIRNSMLFEGQDDDWVKNVDIKEVTYCDADVIYIGWISPTWGHIITDCLKKIWFLKTKQCKDLLDKGCKIIAIIPWENKSIKEVFRLADVDILTINNIKNTTKFRKVFIPDDSIIEIENGYRKYTKEYVEVIKTITDKIPKSSLCENLYFSRTSFSKEKTIWKREFGEEKIEKIFRKMGYTIVYPEKQDLIQNLTMLRNCKRFVSTEGSISHNALFCRPGTEVIILRKVDHVNSWQLIINNLADVNVTYVDAHKSIISTGWLGPFYMCVTDELERFIGKKIFHLPYYLCPSFLWYFLENRRIVKRLLNPFFK